MKSGLRDRNNPSTLADLDADTAAERLNEVRS